MPAKPHGPQIGRLALRHEGANWNAYYAQTDTMEGAHFLGSIRMGLVANNPARRQQFMDLMRAALGDLMKGALGDAPEWGGPQTAPEHERSGNA